MMKDNFSNPNPFLSHAKQFQELVNQPTAADAMAGAFSKGGSQPAQGPQQRGANAFMNGIASGIQGAENQRRQEKLSPILEQAGQITAKAAELEAQAQQEQGRKMTGVNFVKQNITRLMSLGEGSAANDVESTNGMARELGYEYQKAFGLKLGEFDHYDLKSRRIFYRNNDVVTGYSIPDILREYATDAFGEQAPYVMRGLDPYFKNQYENTEMLQKLQLEKERSIASVNNAQAGNYNAQADKTKNEMENPIDKNAQELDLAVKKGRADKNYDAIGKEIVPRLKANENVLGVYEAIEDIRQNNPGIVGSDYYTQAKRTFASSFGLDPDIDYATLKSVEFEKMLKPILGAAFGEREGGRVLSKFINLNQTPEAIDKFLLEEKPKIMKEIVRDKQKIAHYDKENHANLHNEDIHSNLDQEVESYSKTRKKTVTMVAPDGSTREVPKDQVKEWEGAGARVVE